MKMKKLLIVALLFGLLTAPVAYVTTDHFFPASVMAQSEPSAEPSQVPSEAPAVPASDPEPESEPIKLPWVITFFWPFIVTALVGVVKAVTDYAQKEVPAPLWPITSAVLTAIVVGLQSSASPQEAIINIVAAVVAALGFAKVSDSALGKWSTMRPADKAKFKDAVAKGVIK